MSDRTIDDADTLGHIGEALRLLRQETGQYSVPIPRELVESLAPRGLEKMFGRDALRSPNLTVRINPAGLRRLTPEEMLQHMTAQLQALAKRHDISSAELWVISNEPPPR